MKEYSVVFKVQGKLSRKSIRDIKDRIFHVYIGDHYAVSNKGEYIELKKEDVRSHLYCSLFEFIKDLIVFRDFILNWSKINQQ